MQATIIACTPQSYSYEEKHDLTTANLLRFASDDLGRVEELVRPFDLQERMVLPRMLPRSRGIQYQYYRFHFDPEQAKAYVHPLYHLHIGSPAPRYPFPARRMDNFIKLLDAQRL